MEPLWVPLDRRMEDNANNPPRLDQAWKGIVCHFYQFLLHDFADGETLRILPFLPMGLQEPVKRM